MTGFIELSQKNDKICFWINEFAIFKSLSFVSVTNQKRTLIDPTQWKEINLSQFSQSVMKTVKL